MAFPASFIRVTDGDHTVVCEAADEKWVRTALANVKPATRPSTMPTDVLAKIQSTREEITKQIAADTLLPAKDINDTYDNLLLPAEKRGRYQGQSSRARHDQTAPHGVDARRNDAAELSFQPAEQ